MLYKNLVLTGVSKNNKPIKKKPSDRNYIDMLKLHEDKTYNILLMLTSTLILILQDYSNPSDQARF